MYSAQEIERLLKHATPQERRDLDALLGIVTPIWEPDPRNGPQCLAYASDADVIGYGGGAGGGKTDLAIGMALRKHKVTAVFRREGTELTAIIDRITAIIGNREGYNGQERIWREPLPGVQIEFGSVPNLGDEKKYQGRPKDLLVFDEAANFLEQQVRFLMGWVRSTDPAQRCQTLLTFNPPTSSEGQWIIEFFAPWLDDSHPCPAEPGELRWFAMLDGKECEVTDGTPFLHHGELIRPQSRTFIPARVGDNQYLAGTGYLSTLQALPEPLRSQMLYGDFKAGMGADPWQVIPTAWVDIAMARWVDKSPKPRMDSLGVDVARGGKDATTIARRHAKWYDRPIRHAGADTPDGPKVAGLVVAELRDAAPIHIDVIGVGASPYDFLNSARQQVIGVNVAEKSMATDKSGRLRFANLRSELWWKFREELDPANNTGIALPPSKELRTELCTPKWDLRGPVIEVESRDEIVKRIGRSPDLATAFILARMDTPRVSDLPGVNDYNRRLQGHDPYGFLGTRQDQPKEHDPYANMG